MTLAPQFAIQICERSPTATYKVDHCQWSPYQSLVLTACVAGGNEDRPDFFTFLRIHAQACEIDIFAAQFRLGYLAVQCTMYHPGRSEIASVSCPMHLDCDSSVIMQCMIVWLSHANFWCITQHGNASKRQIEECWEIFDFLVHNPYFAP